jgi:hypothetical protein
MMKRLIILVILTLSISLCYSQDDSTDQALIYLRHMDNVVHFTKDQRVAVLELYVRYVGARDNMSITDYSSRVEFHAARISLYLSAKKNVYALCTPEQLRIYDEYRRALNEAFMAKIAKRDAELKNGGAE